MNGEEIIKSLNNWPEIVSKYQNPDRKKAIFQVLTTFVPFFGLWALMYFSLGISYLLTLGLALVTGVFMIRIFIIQHDCGHQSFFKSRRWNNFMGFICSMFSFIPYKYWAREHNHHHAHNSKLNDDVRKIGDISVITVNEYRELPRWKRIRYRLFRNPAVLFGIGPVYYLIVNNRLNIGRLLKWKKTGISLLINNFFVILFYLVLCLIFGWQKFFMIQIPLIYVFAVASIWFFYVQHNHKNNYKQFKENWNYLLQAIRGSTYYKLPKFFMWVTGDIGFHHIHHLSSLIPNYNLEKCHTENPILGKYVTVLTFRESLKCIFNKLWDEDNQVMISFREFYRRERRLTLMGS